MFTIKHVEMNGYEGIVQAASVALMPDIENKTKTLYLYDELGHCISLGYSSGDVYVMNEAGKTVSVYHFN